MRQIENENLAKFIGFCLNGTQYLSVWRYYARSSIEVRPLSGAVASQLHAQLGFRISFCAARMPSTPPS